MASELRVNNIKNRSGLGTVTFADEGLVISGITSFSLGDTSLIVGSASSTGTADQKLQVTGGAYVSGAIGIGTTNPSSEFKLDVSGRARFTDYGGSGSVIEVGRGQTTNAYAYVDLVGDTTYTDYGLRLIRYNTGANAVSAIEHRGTSELSLTAMDAAPIAFRTSNTEKARITSAGYFKASNDGSYWSDIGPYHESRNNVGNDPVHLVFANNASFISSNLFLSCSRAASSSNSFIIGYSGTTADIEFYIRGDGNAYADGSWNGGGADYAEYFEWEDGNPDNEDRRGCTVSLVGDKIKIAEEGDIIIGAISGNPSVVGDAAWNKWDGKYLTDDYGSYILEEHNVVEWTDEDGKQHSYEDWNLPNDIIVPEDAVTKTHDEKGNRFTHRKLNPEYNEMLEYIPRENRPEWDAVGMMGKLRIRKGQVVDSRWIKMKDISATVEEWLVR